MENLYNSYTAQEPCAVSGWAGGELMKTLNNEDGIALVTALLFTLISLGMVMALLFMVLQQTKLSGAHKRYKNSLEASHGGLQLITKELIPAMFAEATDPTVTLKGNFASINLDTSSNNCLQQKLMNVSAGWTACGADGKTYDIKKGWDMTFKLQGTSGPGYNVYAKIVDTQPGNTDTSGFELLDGGAGVTGASAGIAPKHIPAMYRIETQGESVSNPREKAVLSVLYAY